VLDLVAVFVRRSQCFDGNVAEGTTLAGMLQEFRRPAKRSGGGGPGSGREDNLTWLRAQAIAIW